MFSLISLLGLVVAITIHEFAHAYAADRLGDPTPRANGRLTLNPLAHLDPLGTLMLLIARIGWGRPVPVDPYNFRFPRRDELLVSLAGPASNFVLAVILSFFSHLSPIIPVIIIVNVSLGVFNLLPVPPLDGSKIFLNLLSPQNSSQWQQAFDHYGYFILAILLLTNTVSLIVTPVTNFILTFLLR